MGKIFDALEKANEKRAIKSGRLQHANPSDQKVLRSNNVVAFESSSKHLDHKPDPKLIAYHAPQSIEAEHFKVLRTNLLFPTTGEPPRRILITSALPSDGKSFVAANLATSIAQGIEEHVMLIDCDLRKSTVHTYFGYGQTIGLSEHLASQSDLAKFLVKCTIPKLTLLPAGNAPQNPTELLSSKKMKALLDEVAARYDDRYILIDSPPPSMAAETSALVNLVDGVILVVKSGKTPKSAVTEVIDQIGKEKILGIVMNYSDLSSKKYHGYGKKYYSHYNND